MKYTFLGMDRLRTYLFFCALVFTAAFATNRAAAQSITFVDTTSYSSGDLAVDSFELPAPTGIEDGDLLIMSMFHAAEPAITAPTGWTELSQESSVDGSKHTIYYKLAGASEPSSYSWMLDSPGHVAAGMAAYRGVDSTDPIDEQASSYVADGLSADVEITPTVANSQLLLFAGIDAAIAGATPHSGMAERYDTSASTWTTQLADEFLESAATVTRSVSADDLDGGEIFALAVTLRPAPNAAPVVEAVADQSDFEGDFVDLQVEASDSDGDPLTYSATNLPGGLTIGESDGRISGQIAADAALGSPFDVTVTVSDGINPAEDVSFTWSVRAADGSIAFVGSTSFTTAETLTDSFELDVPAGVQEGDLLIMNMFHGARNDPTITSPSGWTQLYQDLTDDGGMHTVYYKIADATEPDSYIWSLDLQKHPAAGMTAYRGVHGASPFDAESQAHEVGASSASVALTTTVANARLLLFGAVKSGEEGATPDVSMIERYEEFASSRTAAMADVALGSTGLATGGVEADDEAGGEIFVFGVALRPASAPNEPPVVEPIADRSSFEGEIVHLQVEASDVDADELTYSASGLPAGITIDPSTGLISGTIDGDAALSSPFSVTVSVSDGENDPEDVPFTWNVGAASGSIAFVGATSYTSGNQLVGSFFLDAPDGVEEGDLLVASMFHGADPDPVLDPNLEDWTQAYQERTLQGKHTVYYRFAKDTDPASFVWDVEEGKQVAAGLAAYRGVHAVSPVAAEAETHVVGAASASLEVTTTVDDARLLLFGAVEASSGGLTPDADMIERYEEVAATRTAQMAAYALGSAGAVTKNVFVDEASGGEIFAYGLALRPSSAPNEAPVVESIADQAGFEGDVVDLQVEASDVDGDELTYSATNLPAGLTLDPASGRITGSIDDNAASGSSYEVDVTVADDVNPDVVVSFAWSVGAASGSIAFVGATSYTSGDQLVGSFFVEVPANVQEEDLLVASVFHGADPDPSLTPDPDVWTELYQDRTEQGKHTVYYKFASSSEPASYTWHLGSQKNVAAGMTAYRGVHGVTPFNAQTTEHVVDATVASLEITPGVDDARLLLFAGVAAENPGATPDSEMAERYETFAAIRTVHLAEEALADGNSITRGVSVDDPSGGEVFAFAAALRPASAPNEPPAVAAIPAQQSFEGDIVSLQIQASDVDGDELTYAASDLPAGLSIDPSSGLITGTLDPDAAAGTPYDVSVSVDDGQHPAEVVPFTWNVGEAGGSIAFVGSTSFSMGETLVDEIPLDVPEGVEEGDLLMAGMYHGANPDPTLTHPTGWTQLYQESTTEGGKHTVYYKFADDSEPSTYTWLLDNSKHPAAGMVAYRGVHAISPFDAQVTTHETDAASAAVEIAPSAGDARMLLFAAVRAASVGATSETGMAERYEAHASGRTAQMSDEALASTDTLTRTVSVDDAAGGEIFALAVTLRPSSAPNEPPFVEAIADQWSLVGDTVEVQVTASDADNIDLTYGATNLPDGLTIGAADGRITGTINEPAASQSPFDVTVSVSDGDDTTSVSLSWIVRLYGDPSGDGEVTHNDASLALQHWAEIALLDEEDETVADVSGNEEVTPFDASLIIRRWAALISCFPVEPGCSLSKGAGAASGVLAFGDVTRTGNTYDVPIHLADASGDVTALEIEVELEEGVEVVDVRHHLPDGWQLVHNKVDGSVKIALVGAHALGDGKIATLSMKADDGLPTLVAEGRVNEAGFQKLSSTSPLDVPEEFALHQNYPNPFNPRTTIRYELSEPAHVVLEVFDALGKRVALLVDGEQEAGRHSVDWSAETAQIASGVYIYRIRAGSNVSVKKMTLMK